MQAYSIWRYWSRSQWAEFVLYLLESCEYSVLLKSSAQFRVERQAKGSDAKAPGFNLCAIDHEFIHLRIGS